MILVDPRAGSKDFIRPLESLGIPIDVTTLDFGDFAFMGRGEKGAAVRIGIEHKKVGDLLSSLATGRLVGYQLVGGPTSDGEIKTGLLGTYDRAYLMVEGDWDHDAGGRITMFKGRKREPMRGAPNAIEVVQTLINLETRGGLRRINTQNRRGSIRELLALYRYWTDKDLDKHKSHLAVHAPDFDSGLRVPVSGFRHALIALRCGAGIAVSKAIEQRVGGSWRKLMLLTEEQLAAIEVKESGKVRRLGTAKARKILEKLR